MCSINRTLVRPNRTLVHPKGNRTLKGEQMKITNTIIFAVLLAALIVGLYYYLRTGSGEGD